MKFHSPGIINNIGIGRLRIWGGGGGGGGGARFRILGGGGGKGGPNSQQAHDVVLTLIMHRHHFDVMCPLGF